MTDRAVDGRVKRFIFVIFAVFALLTARLWHLQIVRGDNFEAMAEVNRIRTLPIRAPRGSIYDAKGRVIVTNRLAFTVSVVPSGLHDPDGSVVARLSELLDMEPGGDHRHRPAGRRVPVRADPAQAGRPHRDGRGHRGGPALSPGRLGRRGMGEGIPSRVAGRARHRLPGACGSQRPPSGLQPDGLGGKSGLGVRFRAFPAGPGRRPSGSR